MTSALKRSLRIALSIVALVALAVAVRWMTLADAQDKRPARTAAAPVVVTTAAVQTRDVPIYRSGVGSVMPLASVVVKTRIDG